MLIADTVQRVIDGTLKNVVINVPPGSSKTELVAINLIARGLALNPRAFPAHQLLGYRANLQRRACEHRCVDVCA
ncbi:hypothetical protein WK78_00590 [Burkholderia cepacia]|nr:hypothetical protein WK78_00590 [Burkholderia cepacia]